MISIKQYLTSDGQYPDRANSPEVTLEVRNNAGVLLEQVNKFLIELGVNTISITSGFRTQAANVATGGSKFSAHCTGEAVDIEDKDKKLYNAIIVSIPLLTKHRLYLEHGNYTSGWVHLTTRRPKSGNRIFIP